MSDLDGKSIMIRIRLASLVKLRVNERSLWIFEGWEILILASFDWVWSLINLLKCLRYSLKLEIFD